MSIEFFQTHMGRKFFEADVPRIIKGIERVAIAMEKHNELMEKMLDMEKPSAPDSLRVLTGPFMISADVDNET